MPSIEDFAKKSRKFKKTKFRPWDYDEELLAGKTNDITVTKEKPKGNQKGIKEKSNGNQTVTKEKPKGIPNGNQLIDKAQLAENCFDDISKLSGLQKKLFFYVIECTERRGDFCTGSIQVSTLVELTKTTKKTIKTALQRLIDKCLVIREADKMKTGKGGFRCYSVTKEIKSSALEFKRMLDVPKKVIAANGNQTVTQRVTKDLSSSSILNNKTTTTELPKEWTEINFSILETEINFSKHYLAQLYKTNITTPQDVQKSIDHFAFDIRKNNRLNEIKKNPLNYFMGIMKRSGMYLAPDNYLSPREQAINEMLKQEREKAEQQKKQIEDLFQIKFETWYKKQTNNFLQSITNTRPDIFTRDSGKVTGLAKNYFKNSNEWQGIVEKLKPEQ